MSDTRSKNFTKWFGNSKLVDENGKPMVLYHGTDRDFSSFDIRKFGASDHGWYGVGHYLTADPEKGSIYSSYRGDVDALHGKKIHPGANVLPVHARLENPYIWPEDRPAATNLEEAIQITKRLISRGYDGVIAPNHYDDGPYASHDEVVVFRPHQIKSAIGNNGEYDSKNADITKSEGGSVDRQKNFAAFVEGNHPEVPHVVYHGTGAERFKNNTFKLPAFFTSDPEAAHWYAMNRGENPQIIPAHLSMKNPLDVRSKEGAFKLIDIAKQANVHTELNDGPRGWDFFSKDIAKHSPYDGTNHLDLLYIPKVRQALAKRGFDGVIADDALSNEEIPTFIPIDVRQIKSAVGNQGTFDPSIADITKAEGGSVDKKGGDTAIHKGRKFWSGIFDAHDGFIKETHPYKRAQSADFHHSLYVSQQAQDAMSQGDAGFFWVDPNGSVNTFWREKEAPDHIVDAIRNQIEPIKKAEGGSVDLSQYQEQTPFGLYSHAAETAAALPQAKGTPDQLKAMLLKQGVKPAELEHSGYDDIFRGRPSVTKDELVEHFRQRMPRIKEHVLGGASKYPKELQEREQAIIDQYTPRLRSLQGQAENYDLSSAERRAASEEHQNLIDSMYQHIDREIPDRDQYLNNSKTKFEQYTLPGGENYREHLLQLERGENIYESKAGEAYRKKSALVDEYDRLPPGDPRGPEMARQIVALQQEYNRLLDLGMDHDVKGFRAGHWDQDDVLAHLRMKDRTGPNGEKVLHVDEIQSDWGQQGRSSGFQDPKAAQKWENYLESLRERVRADISRGMEQNLSEKTQSALLGIVAKMKPHELANAVDATDELNEKYKEFTESLKGIPHGPYVTNTAAWTDLALKRALHEAAKGGYDKIAFTPGDVHVDRYDLSNYVNSIHAFAQENGKIHLNLHDDENPDDYPIERMRDIDPKELHKYVGKEVADRILSRIEFPVRKEYWRVSHRSDDGVHVFGDKIENVDDAEKLFNSLPDHIRPTADMDVYSQRVGGKNAVLRDLDLKIGGEGMKSYYDKIVPKQLTELAKRHDKEAKVENLEMPIEGREPVTMPTLTITPKMRESILRGQRAFADGGEVEGITACHGSPHDFDQFDISKVGTGEGAQSYGHGIYLAEAEPTAKTYRDALSGDPVAETGEKPDWQNKGSKSLGLMSLAQSMDKKLTGDEAIRDAIEDLSRNAAYSERQDIKQRYYDAAASLKQMLGKEWKQNPGHMYEVHINAHPDHFLDWDKPLVEQSNYVKKALIQFQDHLHQAAQDMFDGSPNDLRGADLYHWLAGEHQGGLGSPNEVSNTLKKNGIKGVKYLDQASRAAGEGSRNYVVFDDKLVNVKRKYAFGGTV